MNKKMSKRAAAAVTAAMLLQVFSMSGAVSASSDVAINADNFPDDTFRKYVSDNFDTNGDGSLSQAETDAVNVIAVEETSSTQGTVADLTGISYFKKLQMLRCGNNRLTSLDVSSNPDLVYLDCINNQLTSLDVSRNTALTYLFCSGNSYSIDTASGSFSLGDLPAGFDPARASDWTGAEYDPTTNSLKNITSAAVTCAYDCGNEYYMTVTLAASHINTDSFVTISEETFPDATFRQHIADIYDKDKDGRLSQEEIDTVTEIDVAGSSSQPNTVADLTGIGYFTKLKKLYCYNNQLTSLDVSNNTALEYVYCFDNQLTSLYLGNNTDLKYLDCYSNQLTSLDVRKNAALKHLDCHKNQINSLYLGRNTDLEYLDCYSNQLTVLDISRYSALDYLDCYDNQLTTLDVSRNTALERLYCDGNHLTSIDVDGLQLIYFYCDNNTFSIVTTNGSFSLSELPAGFDPAKASEWTGATYDSETNSLNNFTGDTVTYTYECGNGFTETFTLVVKGNNDDTAVTIGADTFPDAAFRQYVSDNFDTDKDGRLSREETDAVTKIDVSGTYRTLGTVADLTGIGYFTKLEKLYCGYNQLTSLDVSKNTALEDLNCDSNQLTSLDLSKNTALKYLDCADNQLTILDVSKNMDLVYLVCIDNCLTSINIGVLTDMECFDCSENTYSIVTANGSFSLSELPAGFDIARASDWQGAEYDSETNTLKNFTSDTVMYTYNCGNDNYATFKLAVNNHKDDTAVTIGAETFPDETFRQYVSDNIDTDKDGVLSQAEMDAVTEIDVAGERNVPGSVADLTGIGYFTRLKNLDCRYNQLTSLDVSKNTALIMLFCSNNQLTSFDVRNNTALGCLYCSGNKLTSLDVSKNTALESLYCSGNQLASLDVSKNTALIYLDCYYNQLTSLDVRNNTALKYLYCSYNQLTSLDVSNNTDLTDLTCPGNQLTSLDLSNNTALEYLWCRNNHLTSLDVRNNTALIKLDCCFNQLTRLDVSKNKVLTELSCDSNRLTSLALSNNTNLTSLDCADNTYSIGDVVGSFSLSDLPAGFDPAKASEWTGASYDSATDSLKDITGDTITYKYDCGKGKTVTFTLKCTFVEIDNITVNSDSVVVTYSDNTSKTYSFDEVPEAVVEYMTKNDMKSCAAFVNAFSGKGDTMILTAAQLKAVEAVLESDYAV